MRRLHAAWRSGTPEPPSKPLKQAVRGRTPGTACSMSPTQEPQRLAFTAADITTIETAITSTITSGGVRRITVGGRTVEFRSASDLFELLNLVRREVYASTNAVTKADLRNRP